LTFTFASTALADDGVIHGGIAPPPPPAPRVAETDEPILEELTVVALDLMRSLLTLY
jgi:hypothetical protein